MLKLTGKYFAMYISGALTFFAAIAAVTIGIPGISDGLAAYLLLAAFSLLLFWIIFCNKRANANYMRINRILSDQCDPEGFLKAQSGIYAKSCGIKRIRSAVSMNAVTVRMNQAVALSFAGRNKEAMNEINAILALPADKNKDFYHGMCHVDLSVFLSGGDGDIAAAREYLRKAHEHNKAAGQPTGILSGEIIRAEYILDVAEGKNLQAALDYFGKKTNSAVNTRDEAGNRYQLALIYRQVDDTENERAQLEFVAQNAPKAHIGKQSAARLAELSAK